MDRDGILAVTTGSAERRLSMVNDRGAELTPLSDDSFAWAVPRFSSDAGRPASDGALASRS